MKLNDAKQEFVETWGTLGTNWGINRTMAKIHAQLLVSSEPVSTEDLMEQLSLSRGNVNMNIRALVDWGLAEKRLKPGDRKEYFVGDKDIWEVSKKIMDERRKRELKPVLNLIDRISHLNEAEKATREGEEFLRIMKEIQTFAGSAQDLVNKMIRVERSWFLSKLMKLVH